MPTKFRFGNRTITLPGAYSRIVSGRNNPPQDLDYGKILIIDNPNLNSSLTAKNGIMGGSGVNGALETGKDSIYSFNRIQDFQSFVAHGWWYKAAEYLFKPDGTNPGVSRIDIIKPATTTNSLLTFTAVGGGSAGGSFKTKTRDEGVQANGDITGVAAASKLNFGYAYTVETGVIDTAKWIFKIWRGTYVGAYSDSQSYNEISEAVAQNSPQLLSQSPEFDNIQELIDWASTDEIYNLYFVLDATSAVTGAGTIDADDVTAVVGYNVSTGGTETYGTTDLDDALEAVADLDYNYVITTYADPAAPQSDANIIKIQNHLLDSNTSFDKYLILYGDDSVLATNITTATALDSERNILTHGGILKAASRTVAPTGLRTWSSFFHMCYQLGRMLGLEPQVPLTFKTIDIQGLQDNLTKQEQIQALEAGILCTIFDTLVNDFVVLQDVNTLQANTVILNPDGTSHVIQFNRIKAQLNKELEVNARRDLLGNPLGVNRNTLSENDVIDYVKTYLTRKIATPNDDNLILDFGNISVTKDQDAYNVTYEFVPNDEIRVLLFTGFAL